MAGSSPKRAGLVLATLIGVAGVANLNLAVANVALPDIGRAFDAGQTTVDLIAVGYSLGLAASVLYLGAVGDRYGRKNLLLLGMALSIPASILAALAPSATVLFAARVFGGVAAGMAYPTTLALITALWSGPQRTRAIALWSALGGGISALGPLLAGALLEGFRLVVGLHRHRALAAIALFLAWRLIPAHVNERRRRSTTSAGILSIALVASLVLAINFAPNPAKGPPRWRSASSRRGDDGLRPAPAGFAPTRSTPEDRARCDLLGAALAGIIVFGSLMGRCSSASSSFRTCSAIRPSRPAWRSSPRLGMIVVAPRSAKLVESHGSRLTLLVRLRLLPGRLPGDAAALDEAPPIRSSASLHVMGVGVGFAAPRLALPDRLGPVKNAGMASGTADLQPLGGAIMQSIFGASYRRYAKSFANQISASPQASQVSERVQNEPHQSFSSAPTPRAVPQYAHQIGAAPASLLDGGDWTYAAGMVAVAAGIAIVFFLFPRRDAELAAARRYHARTPSSRSRVESSSSSGIAFESKPGGGSPRFRPGVGLAFLDATGVNVALPDIGGLQRQHQRAAVILNGYLLTLASLILLGGSLGDRYGRRRVFIAGVALFTSPRCSARSRRRSSC